MTPSWVAQILRGGRSPGKHGGASEVRALSPILGTSWPKILGIGCSSDQLVGDTPGVLSQAAGGGHVQIRSAVLTSNVCSQGTGQWRCSATCLLAIPAKAFWLGSSSREFFPRGTSL